MVWAAEDHFDILGTRFAVQSTHHRYSELVRTVLEPFLLNTPAGVPARRRYGLVGAEDGDVVAYRDCRRLGPATNLGGAMLRLVAAVNRTAIEEYDSFAVHAGVVAFGNGAIAFPVDSGGGKSTLTAACLLAGFDYVSDEALCMDNISRMVVPYPKPIALSQKSLDMLGAGAADTLVAVSGAEGLLSPAGLQASTSATPLHLRHLVIASYGHDEARLREVAGSDAMAALLGLSFNHYKFGETAFHLAAHLASEVRPWSLTYGDPLAAAKLLRSELT